MMAGETNLFEELAEPEIAATAIDPMTSALRSSTIAAN